MIESFFDEDGINFILLFLLLQKQNFYPRRRNLPKLNMKPLVRPIHFKNPRSQKGKHLRGETTKNFLITAIPFRLTSISNQDKIMIEA